MAKSRSVRGLSHQPAFMGSCLTICQTSLICSLDSLMPLPQSRTDFGHIPLSSRCTRHFSLPHHAPILNWIHPLGGQGRQVWQLVRQLPMKAGWWDAPLVLHDLAVSNLHYHYSEQSVCNLTKRRTQQPVFSGKFFEDGWLRTAATKQSEITTFDVIQFLTMKISFGTPL